MRVVLKDCVWEPQGQDLYVLTDPREVVTLADPEGRVAALFAAMQGDPATVAELRERLAADGVELGEDEVREAVSALDALGLIEEDGDGSLGDPDLDARHFSNLAFFGTYARLGRPRAAFVNAVRRAHVLVLGVGGGGSSIVQCLAGLGIGRMTLVDRDDVESRNFARQFLYHHADIGRSKVTCAEEWVRAYDPRIAVRAVDRWISGPDDLTDLVEGVDVIVGGLDGHPEAHLWTNAAAVRAKIPLVVGGMTRSQIMYYSVDPGRSPCVQCDWRDRPAADEPTAGGFVERSRARISEQNLLIAPVAAQIGSLVAYEALRYLTGFEEPQAAGAFVKLDLRAGLTPVRQPFNADPDCPVCPR
ncbi:ThiF family adenylyltransferase [Nonomuraea mesophila]|uniref:ThiF family adenylyltransferase n=1 Tax=Nonomuraea mesophila TaxID=2530382 RepID=A0A4R5FG01_9ACTN|nr:ThiF family adenylyltransferase [Nonomuraea mesophila]TDE49934.1 ThiF family adenylyltransferase [Nonomuraea mesophila]